MSAKPVTQGLTEGLVVFGEVREDIGKSRLSGLAGQPFLKSSFSRAVPDCQAKRRVVSEDVEVIIGTVALSEGVDPLAQEFEDVVPGPFGSSWIAEIRSEGGSEVEPLVSFPEE
jgi:hypothetical protein